MVCDGQDPKNNLDITVRGGGGRGRGSTVGEGEEGLRVVRDDHCPLADSVFMVGGSHKALNLDVKRVIDMGTRLALNIQERG